jgi:hypothetical protein
MRYLLPAVVVAALTLVGCGGNTATNGDAAPTTAVESSIVPAVDVIDVNTGGSVALRAAIATDKPTLIWMWAPH